MANWGSAETFAAGALIDHLLRHGDFETYPPDWDTIQPDRCAGHCVSFGTPDGLCYCDLACVGFGDCCLDACATCGACP